METAQRYSPKREAIRQELLRSKDHPGAEELYDRLKGEFPDLSLATVYRNLASFREEGEAVRVATVDGTDRFDGNTRPHAHFVCERCGAVLDVESPLPELTSLFTLPGDPRAVSLTFYGICDHCR